MNRLPAVLQKEIWEYVHGDRAFWKTRHELVVDELVCAIVCGNWEFWTTSQPERSRGAQIALEARRLHKDPYRLPKSLKMFRRQPYFFMPSTKDGWYTWTYLWGEFPDLDTTRIH